MPTDKPPRVYYALVRKVLSEAVESGLLVPDSRNFADPVSVPDQDLLPMANLLFAWYSFKASEVCEHDWHKDGSAWGVAVYRCRRCGQERRGWDADIHP